MPFQLAPNPVLPILRDHLKIVNPLSLASARLALARAYVLGGMRIGRPRGRLADALNLLVSKKGYGFTKLVVHSRAPFGTLVGPSFHLFVEPRKPRLQPGSV